MGIFKSPPEVTGEEAKHDNRVEVVVNQDATKKAIDNVREANKILEQLLSENGFTLKIWFAAGGKLPKNKRPKGTA